MATSTEELTPCIVCFEPFRDPQLLPCQHTFCGGCVNRITNAGRIKCPKCNQISPTDHVQPDFRLGVFLDALAKQAEDLTGVKASKEQRQSNESAGKLCDLCEDQPVAHWCNDCSEWLCEHCKKTHSKSKASRDHTFSSLNAKNQEAQASIQLLIQSVDAQVTACERSASVSKQRLDETAAVKTKAVEDCNTLRAECHSKVDQQFVDIEREINALLQPCLSSQSKRLDQIRSNIQKLMTQKREFEQSLKAETGGVIEADTVMGTAKSLVQTITDPDFNNRIPNIKVEPCVEWADMKAARLKTSPRADASGSDTNQVDWLILFY